jgi:hypothetical protein
MPSTVERLLGPNARSHGLPGEPSAHGEPPDSRFSKRSRVERAWCSAELSRPVCCNPLSAGFRTGVAFRGRGGSWHAGAVGTDRSLRAFENAVALRAAGLLAKETTASLSERSHGALQAPDRSLVPAARTGAGLVGTASDRRPLDLDAFEDLRHGLERAPEARPGLHCFLEVVTAPMCRWSTRTWRSSSRT